LVEIRKLPTYRWGDFKDLRLKALKTDPSAYGSSFEEEERLTAKEWRRRLRSVLFALSDGKPVGMISCYFNEGVKTRHIAKIYGFYVAPSHRGRGIGSRLFERAMALIRKKEGIVKVGLAVNPEQRAAVKIYEKAGFVVTRKTEKELKVGRRFYGMQFIEKML
jgi:ribosomal protein S18 acetylase RimI-like enzyme